MISVRSSTAPRRALRGLAALAFLGVTALGPAVPAHATPPGPAVTASAVVTTGPDTGSSTQAATGDTIRYTYALQPGTTANPYATTTVALNGAQDLVTSSVQAPDGTAVTYSTDGSTYTSSPTGARYVRFAGALPAVSAGVATPLSGPLTTFATGGGGDGYYPILTSTRVLNIWHHQSGKVDCHVIATAASCTGYPFAASVGGSTPATGQTVSGAIDPANPNHLWYPAQRRDAGHTTDIGWVCVDITPTASPTDCGWVGVGTTASAASASRLESGGLVAGKLYSIDVSGLVYCLDPAAGGGAGAACGGYPVVLGLPAGVNDGSVELTPIGTATRIIARTNDNAGPGGTRESHLACLDTVAAAPCGGWGTGAAGLRTVPNAPDMATSRVFAIEGDVIPVQSNGTSWDAFCGSTNSSATRTDSVDLSLHCYNLSDGSTRTMPAGLNTALPNTTENWHFGDYGYGHVTTSGHRVYFNMFDRFWADDAAVCYDFAAGAVCPHYPYHFPQDDGGGPNSQYLDFYGQAVTSGGDCLWSYGDGAQFVFGTTADPSKGCASSTTSATTLPVTPAHSYCGTDLSGASWGTVSLRGIASSAYSTATLTVKDSTDTPVSGFNAIPLPGNQIVDISGISKSGNTATLSVSVAFTGIDSAAFNSGQAVLQTTWSGGTTSRFCLDTQPAALSCANAPAMRADSSTALVPLSGGGTVTLASSTGLTNVGTPPTCTVTAPALSSSGQGTATQNSTAPIPPSGGSAALLDAGTPVSTLTVPGQGTYTVDAASGAIAFAPFPGFVGAATPVPYRLTDGYGNTGQSTYTPTVTMPPPPSGTPRTTRGPMGVTQHVTVTPPAGGTVMLLDQNGHPVTSVTFAGKGTYRVTPGTGAITFTAASGFTGTAPAVRYRITDAYGQTATASYTAIVGTQLGATGPRFGGIVTASLYLIAAGALLLALGAALTRWLSRRRLVGVPVDEVP